MENLTDCGIPTQVDRPEVVGGQVTLEEVAREPWNKLVACFKLRSTLRNKNVKVTFATSFSVNKAVIRFCKYGVLITIGFLGLEKVGKVSNLLFLKLKIKLSESAVAVANLKCKQTLKTSRVMEKVKRLKFYVIVYELIVAKATTVTKAVVLKTLNYGYLIVTFLCRYVRLKDTAKVTGGSYWCFPAFESFLNGGQNRESVYNRNNNGVSGATKENRLTRLRISFIRYRLLEAGDIESNPGPGLRPSGSMGSTGSYGGAAHPGVGQEERVALQVISLNVRGLNDGKKVRHLVNRCHKVKNAGNSIFMFQESYVRSLSLLNYIWRGEHILTQGLGNKLGCITLLNPAYKVNKATHIDNRAHVAAISKVADDRNVDFIIVNLYAPNANDNAKIEFFEKIFDRIDQFKVEYQCDNVVIAGDFNLVFDDDEVKNRLISNSEKVVVDRVKNLMTQYNVVDAWATYGSKSFTWSVNRNDKTMFSVLDRIAYNPDVFMVSSIHSDWSFSMSDHAAVTAILTRKEVSSNKGKSIIPRLDPTLLENEDFRMLMDENFDAMLNQIPENWNPHQKLEFAKMSLRTSVAVATASIRARFRDQEKEIDNKINDLITKLGMMSEADPNKEIIVAVLDDQRQLKRDLIRKIGTNLEIKHARRWYNEGELPNKYFLNILKKKTDNEFKCVNKDGNIITDEIEIEKEIVQFYRDLYQNDNGVIINETDDFFRNVEAVNEQEATKVSAALTKEEIYETLCSTADSAPGPDSIPYSYLKYHWRRLGELISEAWNYSLEIKELPSSHKLSYLRLIPKTGKDLSMISNWRPITLSNCDHKLITKTYARRLTKVVSNKIGEEQTAYIPGRLINENVRSLVMMLELAREDPNIDGLIVSLDAKKAFDSVDHNYIRRCLRKFGLSNFVPIFDVLYKGLRSDIIVNNKILTGYDILRGVKQGDALSCIIFIMCMEPLLRNIKMNNQIEAIESQTLPLNIPKLYSFADDVSPVVKNKVACVQAIFTEYEVFSRNSGLMLNADKTEIFRLAQNDADVNLSVNYCDQQYNLVSCSEIKINGIVLLQDKAEMERKNVERVVNNMARHLEQWSRRHLSMLGRILIIKTFAISQLIYVFQSITINEASFKKINDVIFRYIWNRNFKGARAPDRVKRSIVYTSTRRGGYGLINIKELDEAIKLKSLGRTFVTNHPLVSQLRDQINQSNFFNVETNIHCNEFLKVSLELVNRLRLHVLNWNQNELVSNANFVTVLRLTKLSHLLTPAGRRGVPFYLLTRGRPNVTIGELTTLELSNFRNSTKYPKLFNVILEVTRTGVNPRVQLPILPVPNRGTLVSLTKLTSKVIREAMNTEGTISNFKIGMNLTDGEVLNWCSRIRKITSVKLRSTILRTAHADVYSNAKLYKFRMIASSNCNNCDEPVETLIHKVLLCPKAKLVWELLNRKKAEVGLESTNLTVEGIMGIESSNILDLTLSATILQKLISQGGKRYCAAQLVNSVIKSTYSNDKHGAQLKELAQQIS